MAFEGGPIVGTRKVTEMSWRRTSCLANSTSGMT